MMPRPACALRMGLALVATCSPGVAAQVCEPSETLLALAPAEPPDPYAYDASREPVPLFEVVLGVGHVHHAPVEPVAGPPGDVGWLGRVILPLSVSPGSDPSAGIVRGWIVAPGRDPEPLTLPGLIETGYEERSFAVLERRADGWLHIRYGVGAEGPQTAWVPGCALDTSPARMAYAPWSEWLLDDDVSPLFVRVGLPLPLHSEASETSSLVAMISVDDGLEPHEIQGEWMRVTLVQPSDSCRPDVEATRREGWIRWLTEDRGPRVWYSTRGC